MTSSARMQRVAGIATNPAFALADEWTFGTMVVEIAGAGLIGCSSPARRASRVEPQVALRCE